MFAILYMAFTTTSRCIGAILEHKSNNKNKINYQDKDGLTYIDSKGRSRLLSNNHLAVYTSANGRYYGDRVLEDIEDHVVIRNFSEENRKNIITNNLNKAKENQKSVYCCDANTYHKRNQFFGFQYKDIETGQIYVVRCIDGRIYYMDISNGHIIRETEYSKINNGFSNYTNHPVLDIDNFNCKQDKQMLNYNWKWSQIYDNITERNLNSI